MSGLGGIGGVRGTVRDCGSGLEEVEGCGVCLVCVLCVLGSVRDELFVLVRCWRTNQDLRRGGGQLVARQ